MRERSALSFSVQEGHALTRDGDVLGPPQRVLEPGQRIVHWVDRSSRGRSNSLWWAQKHSCELRGGKGKGRGRSDGGSA